MTKDELIALKVDPTLHENPTLLEMKDIPSALKALVDTKSFVGNSLRIPGPDASAEDKAAFNVKLKEKLPNLMEIPNDPAEFEKIEGDLFARLGRPGKTTEYPLLKDLQLSIPEGARVDEDALRETAGKLGLTKKQYKELATGVLAEQGKQLASISEQRTALKKELGDAMSERLAAAAVAARKLGADEAFVTSLKDGQVPVSVAKMWINTAKALGTEGSEFSREGGGSGAMTPDEARAQVEEIYRNPIIFKKDHPDHKRLAKRLVELTALAEGVPNQ